jgi:hypothetical protein
MATMEAPRKAVPNDAKIVAKYDPMNGTACSVLAPSIRTIVIRKFLEFFSELLLMAAMPPRARSNGTINGKEIKPDTIAKRMASDLAANMITFIFPSQFLVRIQAITRVMQVWL